MYTYSTHQVEPLTIEKLLDVHAKLMEDGPLPTAIKCNNKTLDSIRATLPKEKPLRVISSVYGLNVEIDEDLADGEVEFKCASVL